MTAFKHLFTNSMSETFTVVLSWLISANSLSLLDFLVALSYFSLHGCQKLYSFPAGTEFARLLPA